MKKFFLLTLASLMTVFAMAKGDGSGSTKANAIEFDWDKGNVHMSGTKWYHVDLTPLYEEENPSLTLYVTNPDRSNSVNADLVATVAGETETKHYVVSPHEHQTYTANATVLVRMRQTEIYLTLTTDGTVNLSAKVFEAADLDETCKDARVLKWDTETEQKKGFTAWWKVDISQFRDTTLKKDAKVTITNTGTGSVNLKTGQSLDCPSSGLTKRNFTLAAGESVIDTIPQSMIASVYPDELYFWIENQEQPVKMKVELVDQPISPVIPDSTVLAAVSVNVNPLDTTIENLTIPIGQTLYALSVKDMDALAKYEPEFTYRNEGLTIAHVTVKMAFERPAFGTTNTSYELAAGGEEIVVYKKNMLDGMIDNVDSIYLLISADQPVRLYSRFKHVREGKACKTNIDFNWESGHRQEAGTTQWYAVDVTAARDSICDIIAHVQNLGSKPAKLKAMLAFSCPYIDLQEVSRTLDVRTTPYNHTIKYSSYAMMTDTVWIGIETSQDIKFWADTVSAKTKPADDACLHAVPFNWENGVEQFAGDTVWYKIKMKEVRDQAAKFPTVFVQNLSTTNEAKIEAELSLECPDIYENESRKLTIAAKGSYSRKLSRNMFENISEDSVYVRVISSEHVALQIRLTEEVEGASCASAIPFNWVSGNIQAADANLWYAVDLREVMKGGNDIELHIENRDNKAGKGVVQLVYSCPVDEAPSVQDFSLAAGAERKPIRVQNSAFDMLSDSIIYINLQSSTSVHFWAKILPVEAFDTIYADGLNLIPLQWDSLYEQDADTAWYIIKQEEIDKVRNMDEKVKPVAHLINLPGNAEMTIKGEAAFAFPIVKNMMTKSQKLKVGQHITDTIPAGTFDQFLKKDSIILRVIRKEGAGKFQFKAELVKAFSGNTRYDALPVKMGDSYGQAANTEIWYKVKTADLKADKALFNKSLNVIAKNAGAGETTVKVAVYEGLLSEQDLFEEYAIDEKYRERKLKKGESKSHNVPAQAIYAVGDLELYIKVRTSDSIYFSSAFGADYAPLTKIDSTQKDARMVVPNVDYEIPGDNQEHWYLVCAPYIQNNYIYTDSSTLTYELNGTATIEATATFQDFMDCQMPVRKRTINKSGGPHKGTKPLSELVNKALEKAGMKYDVSSFQDKFVDSLLHKFITKDSVTGYVRIKTDKPIKFRINTPQVRGLKDCNTDPMFFDWEHGNVNPADQRTWYLAMLDSTKIPEGKDLRIHLDNWSDTASATANAKLYFKCGDPEQGHITKTIAPNDGEWKDIARDFIANAGWPSMLFLDYHSDKTTHLWIELVDQQPRDTVRTDTTFFVCAGDPIIGKEHTVIVMNDTVWNDTISDLKNETKAALYDSISTVRVYVKRVPKVAGDFSSQVSIKRGQVLDMSAATAWLEAQYAPTPKNDTLQKLDTITWQYAIYSNSTYMDIDPANQPTLASEFINIRYTASFECGGEVSDTIMNTVRDTLPTISFCKDITWGGKKYDKDTLAFDTIVKGIGYWGDSIQYVQLQKLSAALGDTTVNDVCKSFTWHGVTYMTDTVVVDTLPGAAYNGCDSIVTLHLTLLPMVKGDTTTVNDVCKSYTWHGVTYVNDTIVSDTLIGAAYNGCDSIATLNLILLPPVKNPISFDTCNMYTWHGVTYYNDTIVSDTLIGGAYNGCDSIVTLTLTINKPYNFTLPMVPKYGDRLLMIDRNAIVKIPGWESLPDSVDSEGNVTWWKEATPVDSVVLNGSYYYSMTNGQPIPAGTYYATISLPAMEGSPCGVMGETKHYPIAAAAAAPALVPSLARPGEDVRVINLDPDKTTTIRLYTTEGLLQKSFVVSGETTFVIKAADAHGFYLVELSNESLKTTLRYIVK